MARPLNLSSLLALTALLVAVLMLGPAAGKSQAAQCKGGAKSAYTMGEDAAAKATLCLLNKERAAHGLGALHEDVKQTAAAVEHNQIMVRTECFSHLCPGEKDLVARIASTGYLPCVCTWQVGENIAWGSGKTASPRLIVAAWMSSAPHRVNILNPKFDEIGIAVDSGSPEGDIEEASTYTTDFGFKS